MRNVTLALLLTLAALAGCSSGDEGDGSGPSSEPVAGASTWVHTDGAVEVAASGFPGQVPLFEQLHVTSRISGEPTVAITRTGAVFYPAIDFDVGAAGVTSLPRTVYLRSVDGGATWEDFSPNVAGVATHPTSFDPYVYADPTTGRVYALDMGPHVACNKVSWSDDDGRTWMTRDGACPLPVADHPSIFAAPKVGPAGPAAAATDRVTDYPNNVILCTNQVADVQCSLSPDGGLTWLPSQPVFLGARSSLVDEGTENLADVCGSLTGHGHASFVDGTVYLGRAYCGLIVAGISRDGGLTWEQSTIVDAPQYAPRGEHDVSIATDLEGTAYAFWIGTNGTTTWLAVSHDQGRSWGEPMNVTAPGVTAAKLPSLVAGAAGRVAFQYVATTTPSGWEVEDLEAGEHEHYGEWLNATWNAYVGVSLDADQDSPVFATALVNDPARPLRRGGCEGRCFGDVGGMYDFFDIDFDPLTGRLWTALVDVCTGDCDEAGATAETFQRSFGAVGRQVGGTFLLDEPYPER